MHSIRSFVAVLALALGATAVASGEAYARDPDKEIPVEKPVAVVRAVPGQAVPGDAGAQIVWNGASALGGAGVACGLMWVYRRRIRPVH